MSALEGKSCDFRPQMARDRYKQIVVDVPKLFLDFRKGITVEIIDSGQNSQLFVCEPGAIPANVKWRNSETLSVFDKVNSSWILVAYSSSMSKSSGGSSFDPKRENSRLVLPTLPKIKQWNRGFLSHFKLIEAMDEPFGHA